MNNFLDYTLYIFIVAAGILIISIAVFQYLNGRTMDEWQITRGKISRSRIRRNRGIYDLTIEYKYSVQNAEYTGRLIRITGKATPKTQVAREWSTQYVEGKEVNVFYKPYNPKLAVLEKGYSGWIIAIEITFGLLSIFVGLFFLVSNSFR